MSILGSLLAIGVALAFAAVAGLVIWGGLDALRQEIAPGFKIAPGSSGERMLTLIGLIVPMLAVAILSALSAIGFFAVALGMN